VSVASLWQSAEAVPERSFSSFVDRGESSQDADPEFRSSVLASETKRAITSAERERRAEEEQTEKVCDEVADGRTGGRERVSARAVRTGVLVIQGVSKVTGVTDLDTAKFTHFAAWFSARFLDARASWSSRRNARVSSSKAAISRPSLLMRIELILFFFLLLFPF